MSETETDPLLTVRQAAEHLSVSVDYIYDRIDRGELTTIQLWTTRSMRRIRKSALDAFLAAREVGPTSR